jgi:hypothetical protein
LASLGNNHEVVENAAAAMAFAVGMRCFMTQDHRLIAADWQPDGSRDHDEHDEVWQLRVQPASQGARSRLRHHHRTSGARLRRLEKRAGISSA